MSSCLLGLLEICLFLGKGIRHKFLHGFDEHGLVFVSLHCFTIITINSQPNTTTLPSNSSNHQPKKYLLAGCTYYYFLTTITTMSGKENANPNHPYLFSNSTLAQQLKPADIVKERLPVCLKHREEVGKYFCQDCLSYNLCSKCAEDHPGHTIRKFQSSSQAREETKEILLLEVEGTLNRMKGRENELKNQIAEISLIKQRLKELSDEIITNIKHHLEQLEQKIQEKLKTEFDKYERELDTFYRQYNSVNDFLRQNLLQIIDGQVDILSFSKGNVSRDVDPRAMPQFGKMKQVMEKCKKYLRNVKESTKELQNSIRFFSNEEEKTHLKFEKYDRFLKQKSFTQESNMPLLRTLTMLEQHQPDLTVLRSRIHN